MSTYDKVNSIDVSSDALFAATGRLWRLIPKGKEIELYQHIYSLQSRE